MFIRTIKAIILAFFILTSFTNVNAQYVNPEFSMKDDLWPSITEAIIKDNNIVEVTIPTTKKAIEKGFTGNGLYCIEINPINSSSSVGSRMTNIKEGKMDVPVFEEVAKYGGYFDIFLYKVQRLRETYRDKHVDEDPCVKILIHKHQVFFKGKHMEEIPSEGLWTNAKNIYMYAHDETGYPLNFFEEKADLYLITRADEILARVRIIRKNRATRGNEHVDVLIEGITDELIWFWSKINDNAPKMSYLNKNHITVTHRHYYSRYDHDEYYNEWLFVPSASKNNETAGIEILDVKLYEKRVAVLIKNEEEKNGIYLIEVKNTQEEIVSYGFQLFELEELEDEKYIEFRVASFIYKQRGFYKVHLYKIEGYVPDNRNEKVSYWNNRYYVYSFLRKTKVAEKEVFFSRGALLGEKEEQIFKHSRRPQEEDWIDMRDINPEELEEPISIFVCNEWGQSLLIRRFLKCDIIAEEIGKNEWAIKGYKNCKRFYEVVERHGSSIEFTISTLEDSNKINITFTTRKCNTLWIWTKYKGKTMFSRVQTAWRTRNYDSIEIEVKHTYHKPKEFDGLNF